MSGPKPDVRFYVEVHSSKYDSWGGSKYAHFTARAMVLDRETHGQSDAAYPLTLHSPDSYSIPGTARELAGLQVTAQLDETSREWYGWRVAYNRDQVELRDAEEMIKVLRKIDKRMHDISSQYGQPADLASFCGHAVAAVANLLHAFMRPVDANRDYEATGYRSMDVDSLRYWLQDETAQWRKDHGIDPDAR